MPPWDPLDEEGEEGPLWIWWMIQHWHKGWSPRDHVMIYNFPILTRGRNTRVFESKFRADSQMKFEF